MHHIGLTLFHDKNSKNFLGRGTAPSPEPSGEGAQPPSQTTRPVESEHPLPTPGYYTEILGRGGVGN